MKYTTILMDLDGTLTDPGLGITNAVMYALKKAGITPPPRSDLYKFIGPPLMDSFRKFYQMNNEAAAQATAWFREYYTAGGNFENTPYPGIDTALQTLLNGGCRLVVATSKPQAQAELILEHFGLARYFDAIAGASLDESRSKKAQVIAYALKEFRIDPAAALMVGDREHDVLGAKECGLPAVGVLYGYGDEPELTAAGAVAICPTVEDLPRIILEEL